MQYHIARNGQQIGVFALEEIQAGLASGRFFPEDLCWSEGMDEWQPLSTQVVAVGLRPPSVASGPAAAVNPYASPRTDLASSSLARPLNLASLGARLAAACLDVVVVCAASVPFIIGFVLLAQAESATPAGDLAEFPAAAAVWWLGGVAALGGIGIYNLVLLATRGQTLGKMWVKIRIIAYPKGEEAGFVKAFLIRGLVNGLIVQFVPFYGIVDLCFIFREDRRCLHDLIAETAVVAGDPPAKRSS